MKGAHPNLDRIAILAITICTAFYGCRSQQGMAVNPFLAPDRVPPPATRALLPGQAQPYYPGDPLPVMQSATSPQVQSPPTTNLARPSRVSTEPVADSKIASKEPVAIPADTSSLRFATSQTPDPPPNASTNVLAATPVAPSQPAVQQPVVPAAYYETAASDPARQPQLASLENVPPVSSPWRSPQMTAPTQPAIAPTMAHQIAMVQPAPSNMAVRLRAVPSPATSTSTPRIRLPGYAPAQPMHAAPTYGTIVQPAFGGVLQTVQTTPIPPNSFNAGTNLAAMPPASTSGDGFRPRGSMR